MRREFVAVAAGETLLEVQRTMRLARLRHLLVVDGAVLVGILSYRDVQEAALVQAGVCGDGWAERLRGVTAREAMVSTPYFVRPDTRADEAARRMLGLRLGCLPVCEGDGDAPRVVGLLAESDLLRAAWA